MQRKCGYGEHSQKVCHHEECTGMCYHQHYLHREGRESVSDRGVPINQPLISSSTPSYGQKGVEPSFRTRPYVYKFLPTCLFFLMGGPFKPIDRSATLSEGSMEMTSLQRQLSLKYRRLSLIMIEQIFKNKFSKISLRCDPHFFLNDARPSLIVRVNPSRGGSVYFSVN